MNRERRLGRGLEALLGRTFDADGPGDLGRVDAGQGAATSGISHLNVYSIDSNPYQPRRDFDDAEIRSLAESLTAHGLIHPIVVRSDGGRYQLISGERRLRAAILAGWTEVPAQVREVDDRQMAEMAIVENMLRKDLNPLEKASSFQQYLSQYGCTQEELAGRLKVDRSTIANLIRLLELPPQVQDSIRSGVISQGHARALLPLGDEAEQVAFCERIRTEQLSVRQTESLVQEQIRHADGDSLALVSHEGATAPPARAWSEHLGSLEQELRTALGTKVDIREAAKGSGRIVVHFKSHDEFERLRRILTSSDQASAQIRAG